MPKTPIVAPRVPFVDPRTGLISREWYRFLMNQDALTGGSAITRTSDSNVTLTLGGSPDTAALAPVSFTLGWTGQLPIARGGTGADTAAGALTALGAAPVGHAHPEYQPLLGFVPVNRAGDTMLGPLTLEADPTDNLQAATKQYVDAAVAAGPAGSFNPDDLLTVWNGTSFDLVFTDAGNVVAVG